MSVGGKQELRVMMGSHLLSCQGSWPPPGEMQCTSFLSWPVIDDFPLLIILPVGGVLINLSFLGLTSEVFEV